MIESMKRVAQGRKLGAIIEQPDPFVVGVISGWPVDMQAARAAAIGPPKDDSVDSIVRDYIGDYVDGNGG